MKSPRKTTSLHAIPVETSFSGQIDVLVDGGPSGNGADRTHIRGEVLGYFLDAPFTKWTTPTEPSVASRQGSPR